MAKNKEVTINGNTIEAMIAANDNQFAASHTRPGNSTNPTIS